MTPHLFRYTGVTWMAEWGMSYRQIELQAGHRDLETLMKVYDHPDREKAKEAFEDALCGVHARASNSGALPSARDLLASLEREGLLKVFRELLIAGAVDSSGTPKALGFEEMLVRHHSKFDELGPAFVWMKRSIQWMIVPPERVIVALLIRWDEPPSSRHTDGPRIRGRVRMRGGSRVSREKENLLSARLS